MGCSRDIDDVTTAEKGIDKVRMLINECGIPSRLRDVGIPEIAINDLATEAMKIQRLLKNNPRTITMDDAVDIYKAAY